jgi:hypothetical protein
MITPLKSASVYERVCPLSDPEAVRELPPEAGVVLVNRAFEQLRLALLAQAVRTRIKRTSRKVTFR